MFLDITADVLLGTATIPGILPDVLAAFSAPAWLSDLLLNRPVFLALYTLLIVAPVCLKRNMASLGPLTVAGLAALAAFGLSLTWLSAAAIYQGKAYALPGWPDPAPFVANGRVGVAGALTLLSTLPVILTASGCQLNILPLAGIMRPFSKKSMDSVVAVAMVSEACMDAVIRCRMGRYPLSCFYLAGHSRSSRSLAPPSKESESFRVDACPHGGSPACRWRPLSSTC
jgi:amino acid permease